MAEYLSSTKDNFECCTFRELIRENAVRFSDRYAFAYCDGNLGFNKKVTYKQFMKDVFSLGEELLARTYPAGSRIGIWGKNCYEGIVTYFAAICSGYVIVPINSACSIAEAESMFERSKCQLVVYAEEHRRDIPQLTANGLQALSIQELFDQVKPRVDKDKFPPVEQARISKDDLASILYTSGTSGNSKGVLLSQYALVRNGYRLAQCVRCNSDSLLLLPIHHIFSIIAISLEMNYGGCTYICSSLRRYPIELKESDAGFLFIVPMFVQNLYMQIQKQLEKQGKKKKIERLIKLSCALRKIGVDLRKPLFKDVRAIISNSLDIIGCGGAALPADLATYFRNIGVTVINGYGMTEAAGVITAETEKQYCDESVGKPLGGVSIQLKDPQNGIGEILIKGECLMQGYLDDPVATADAFEDGWLKTGDLGLLDKNGFLKITGRNKNLIILENGENVSPEGIEANISNIPYVKEVVCYEHDGKICAEVFMDKNNALVRDNPEVEAMLNKDILSVNRKLPDYMQIRKVIIRDTEFEKTSSNKIKRKQD